MASDETITKMRYIVEVWKREGLNRRQMCLMVLGIKGPLQGEADVKKHYFNLVKEIHPDKTHHELSNTAFPIVKSAFEELKKSAPQTSRPPASGASRPPGTCGTSSSNGHTSGWASARPVPSGFTNDASRPGASYAAKQATAAAAAPATAPSTARPAAAVSPGLPARERTQSKNFTAGASPAAGAPLGAGARMGAGAAPSASSARAASANVPRQQQPVYGAYGATNAAAAEASARLQEQQRKASQNKQASREANEREKAVRLAEAEVARLQKEFLQAQAKVDEHRRDEEARKAREERQRQRESARARQVRDEAPTEAVGAVGEAEEGRAVDEVEASTARPAKAARIDSDPSMAKAGSDTVAGELSGADKDAIVAKFDSIRQRAKETGEAQRFTFSEGTPQAGWHIDGQPRKNGNNVDMCVRPPGGNKLNSRVQLETFLFRSPQAPAPASAPAAPASAPPASVPPARADASAAPAPAVAHAGAPQGHHLPAADSAAASAALRTPTDAEVASIFNPSTGLCEWKVRCDQCELTYGHGAEIVGRRVTVYWEEDKRWYNGTVRAYKPADEAHVVVYDDGDKRIELLHFVHTRWRFLIDPTSPAPKSHADTGTATATAAFGGVAGRKRTSRPIEVVMSMEELQHDVERLRDLCNDALQKLRTVREAAGAPAPVGAPEQPKGSAQSVRRVPSRAAAAAVASSSNEAVDLTADDVADEVAAPPPPQKDGEEEDDEEEEEEVLPMQGEAGKAVETAGGTAGGAAGAQPQSAASSGRSALAVGQRVEARYMATEDPRHKKWYKGTISAVYPDGCTFDINYDDGDSEQGVAGKHVRPLETGRAAATAVTAGPESAGLAARRAEGVQLRRSAPLSLVGRLLNVQMREDSAWKVARVEKYIEGTDRFITRFGPPFLANNVPYALHTDDL